jgi:organizing structure protein 2
LIPNEESITPGILYVGVATLAGSVFTRYRSFPIRVLTPPLFLIGSLNYFLPKTAHNVSQYYLELESKHLPQSVREQRENALRLYRQSLGSAKVNLEKAKEESSKLVNKGLASVEQGTGLKVGSGPSAQPSTTTDGRKMV